MVLLNSISTIKAVRQGGRRSQPCLGAASWGTTDRHVQDREACTCVCLCVFVCVCVCVERA